MNFLKFFQIFLNLFGFTSNLFLFKNILKIGFYICVDVADDVASGYVLTHDDMCA